MATCDARVVLVLSILSDFEKELLMILQYRFPLNHPDPYEFAAKELGVSEDRVLETLSVLRERRVLKRIGFYHNPRSAGKRGVALVAFMGGDVNVVKRLCGDDPEITHCYERIGGGEWRIWVVRRARDYEELLEWAAGFADSIGAKGFEILSAKRLHRLSVKYDLYRGVSRAGPYTRVVLNPPSPEELGVPGELPKLVKSLPLVREPYRPVAEKLGWSVERVLDAIRLLLEKGVLGDPGAVLDGHRLGFTHNAMVVVKGEGSLESICNRVVEEVPEATHIVERIPYPPDTRGYWAPSCYAMVHAVEKSLVEPVAERIERLTGVKPHILYSVKDLKPGAER